MDPISRRKKYKRSIPFKTGYLAGPPAKSIFFNCLSSFAAFFLMVLALPLFILVALVLKIKDGGPIIYSGVRLGLNKEQFTMFKFRTLPVNAQQIIGGDLLSGKHRTMVSPLTKFLRDTRLDELPQLFNVLKGDMVFIGPRPVRPEVYEERCKHIKNYDRRFQVKPGLIGYSQLFTPHSSPKRLRSLIDNKYLTRKRFFLWDYLIVFYTAAVVIDKILVSGWHYIKEHLIKEKILKLYTNKRALHRISHPSFTAEILRSDGDRY